MKRKPHSLVHLADRLFDTPHAVTARRLHALMWALQDRFDLRVDLDPRAESDFNDEPAPGSGNGWRIMPNGVAVIEVHGTLVQRAGGIAAMSGLLGYNHIDQMLSEALDQNPKALLLDIDSPGGETSGLFDLADRIAALRGQLPTAAIIRDCGCSAAYAIASAAERVFVTQSATAGSIGVIMAHVDQTKAESDAGVAVTEIYSSDFKADGSPHHELDDDELGRLQSYVDGYYNLLVSKVAQFRGVSEQAIRDTKSGIYVGAEAVEAGLAEGVHSFEQVVELLAEDKRPTPSAAAAATEDTPSVDASSEVAIDDEDADVTEAEESEELEETTDGDQVSDEGVDANTSPLATALQVVQACNDAGLPSLAARLLENDILGADAEAAIAEAKKVIDICAAFDRSDMADNLVAKGLSAEEARKLLEPTAVTPDDNEIDGHIDAPTSAHSTAVIDVNGIYDHMRSRGKRNGAALTT